ncbi:Ribonuclease H domain [Sesbania bispinosa]|nr:Ribonuclease H domain [Sesbania bispinosa]
MEALSRWIFLHENAYELICDFPEPPINCICRSIWGWKGPVRAQNFLWMLAKGGLETNCFRWERGLASSSACPVCHADVETDRHLFMDCPEVCGFWESLVDRPRCFMSRDLAFPNWLHENLNAGDVLVFGIPWNLFFGIACWAIWRLRNDVVFNNKCWDHSGLLYLCLSQAREFTQNSSLRCSVRDNISWVDKWIRWIPPEDGWCKWNLDGSVIQHRGAAASGAVLRDTNGNWLCGVSRNVGFSSITVAELWAFMDAAKISISRKDEAVSFESDSLTAVNFVKLGVPPNHPCYSLVSSIRSLLNNFRFFSVSHVYREGNYVADTLARIGHSLPLGWHVFGVPPPSIRTLILGDSSGVSFVRRFAV